MLHVFVRRQSKRKATSVKSEPKAKKAKKTKEVERWIVIRTMDGTKEYLLPTVDDYESKPTYEGKVLPDGGIPGDDCHIFTSRLAAQGRACLWMRDSLVHKDLRSEYVQIAFRTGLDWTTQLAELNELSAVLRCEIVKL